MSSDTSDITPPHSPIEVGVEGLVLRPDAFSSPGKDSDRPERKTSITQAYAAVAREKSDFAIAATSKAIPLWALLPIIAVGIAAGSFVSPNSLSFSPNVRGYDYPLSFPEGVEGGGAVADEYDPKIWLAKGKAEYAGACVVCHQPTGEGVPGQFPPLKNSEWVIQGEERVLSILFHGIAGQLQVNGKTYNGAMPAQGTLKNNKALAQIASYIRNEWGNKGSIIYDDQLVELRKRLSSRTTPYTEAELNAIPKDANLPPSKHGLAPAVPTAAGTPTAAGAPPAPSVPAPAVPAPN